jgi:hypothetical protein
VRIFLALLFFSPVQPALIAQVVNIESQRLQSDSTGWLGGADASLAYLNNGKVAIDASASVQIEYKAKKDLYLILGDYALFKGDGESFNNAAFGHLRYNRKFGKVLRWELFTQLQFNEITRIRKRWLAGTGPRFKILGGAKLKCYAGALYMFEYEEADDEVHTIERNHRNSSYLSFTFLPSEKVILVSTTYFQPLIDQPADYRLMSQETFSVGITDHLALEASWNFLYDSMPVTGVPPRILSFSSGVSFRF